MRAIDIFSGAGGASLGLIEAGIEVVAAVEWDKDAAESYRRNIGDHVLQVDVETLDPATLPDVDLIHGSPPCQGFSYAGKRDPDDPRNKLWREFFRIVEAKRPAWVTIENVRGILRSLEHDEIIAALSGIGYRVTPYLLCAADYGVPQKRWRVVYVANRIGVSNPPPVQTHADPMPPAKRRNAKRQRAAEPARQVPLGMQPWVSVRQALSIAGDALMKQDTYDRTRTSSVDEPALTLTAGTRTDHIPQIALADGPMLMTHKYSVTERLEGDGRTSPYYDGNEDPARTISHEPHKVMMQSSLRGDSTVYDLDSPARTINVNPTDHGFVEDLDDASGTIRAGTHGAGGFSPRHRAGWIPDVDRLTNSELSHGVVFPDDVSVTIKAGGHVDRRGHMGGTAVPLIPNIPLDDASPSILAGVGNENSKHSGGAEPVRHRLRNRYAEHGDGSDLDDAAPTVSADRALEEHFDLDDASTTVQGDSRLSRPGHHGPADPRMGFRRLTVWECQVLQDFPPDFVFEGTKTSQHRQIGNAFPRGLVRAVAKEIKRVHDDHTRNVPGSERKEQP